MEKKEEAIIVISAIVAILCSKVADFLLPLSVNYHFLNNAYVDPWLGLLANIVILVVIAFLILKLAKFIAFKYLED